jgi:hypothetical protein
MIDYRWHDDFAPMRNHAIDHATGAQSALHEAILPDLQGIIAARQGRAGSSQLTIDHLGCAGISAELDWVLQLCWGLLFGLHPGNRDPCITSKKAWFLRTSKAYSKPAIF